MKKREANFELLRIVAMLMIITLHYLDKGEVLVSPLEAMSATGYTAWILEAFCVASVNVYVLISAYFLADSEYRPMKVLKLWAEVLFYSIAIGVVLVFTGVIPAADVSLYRCMNWVFPVVEEHYWFVTAYILMFLLAPLMNRGLKELPKKSFGQGVLMLGILLSVSKTILPVKLPTDRMGYDAVWFLFLYLLGAYFRFYGIPGLEKKRKTAVACYVASCLIIFISMIMVRGLYLRTGRLEDFVTRQYQYNSVFCLAASVTLFAVFKTLPDFGRKAERLICRVASASFGVYLIHEHIEVRYLWSKLIQVSLSAKDGVVFFLLYWLLSIIMLYLICMAIDFLRQKLFTIAERVK